MHEMLIIFSGMMTVLLIILLNQKRLHSKYKKIVFVYILLFVSIFFGTFFTHKSSNPIKLAIKKGVYIALSKTTIQDTAVHFVDEITAELPSAKIKDHVLLDAPIIRQLPELPRGCEVTSLAMLLADAGIENVDKLQLANEVKKDTTPYKEVNGVIYFGHPNNGFVGNMYDKRYPGLGVYHKPIKELASKYLPFRIIDFTGEDFSEVERHLSTGSPVWVITNTTFKKLPAYLFETWHTPNGTIKITYYEHSVLLTGYDQQYVYFNDPLSGEKNRKVPKKAFIESWEQMGKQAITYLP